MSKIDDLCATVARIEQKVDDIKPRLDSHSKQIAAHEANLNGTIDSEGLNEWHRNFNKRQTIISTCIPAGIIIAWELIKKKIIEHW